VHKSATAEVLLTDAAHLGDDRFVVAAVWHRDHFLGHRGAPASDPVLLAETARQAAIHLSHRFHDIPEGRPFVLDEVAVELDEALPPADREPLALGLDIRCRRTAGPYRRTSLERGGAHRALPAGASPGPLGGHGAASLRRTAQARRPGVRLAG
jgi:hypothetical protein